MCHSPIAPSLRPSPCVTATHSTHCTPPPAAVHTRPAATPCHHVLAHPRYFMTSVNRMRYHNSKHSPIAPSLRPSPRVTATHSTHCTPPPAAVHTRPATTPSRSLNIMSATCSEPINRTCHVYSTPPHPPTHLNTHKQLTHRPFAAPFAPRDRHTLHSATSSRPHYTPTHHPIPPFACTRLQSTRQVQ